MSVTPGQTASRAASSRTPRRAVVLSGGGARGAYEAGVLRFILSELPKHLGHPVRPELVLGTSVGAIHACYLAATAHQGPERSQGLAEAWERMQFEEIFNLSLREVGRVARRLMGLRALLPDLPSEPPPEQIYGVLDATGLNRIVVDAIPWPLIRRNVRAGRLEGVCVSATQIATGRVIIFIEGSEAVQKLGWTHDPSVVPSLTRVGPLHALASAAIPILFPAVRLGGTYYVDGGLRLNTPLAPAIHLGADRILVIALRRGVASRAVEDVPPRLESYGNPLALYGKVLNALLLDHLDTDLGRMHFVNSILESGEQAVGVDFLERLNDAAGRSGDNAFRIVHDLVIRPSRDVGILAGEVLEAKKPGSTSGVARRFLSALAQGGGSREEDLLSFLFFDADFTTALMALGYEDARAQEDELVEFFRDPD